jgi:hypothetical protein
MTQAGTFEQLIRRHTEIEESAKEEQAGCTSP